MVKSLLRLPSFFFLHQYFSFFFRFALDNNLIENKIVVKISPSSRIRFKDIFNSRVTLSLSCRNDKINLTHVKRRDSRTGTFEKIISTEKIFPF